MTLPSSKLPEVLFDFNKTADVKNWIIVNDAVMGGQSISNFKLNTDGYCVFEGDISLEKNGGFSSLRYRFEKRQIKDYTKISIKLQGDGKKYQFRIKTNSGDYFAYITTFLTSGKWQEIEITLKDMYPIFRGKKLNKPNFPNDTFLKLDF